MTVQRWWCRRVATCGKGWWRVSRPLRRMLLRMAQRGWWSTNWWPGGVVYGVVPRSQRHQSRTVAPRSDGQDYTGWSAVAVGHGPPAAGTRGVVTGREFVCGDWSHTIAYGDGEWPFIVSGPLPDPNMVDLIPPGADAVSRARRGGMR